MLKVLVNLFNKLNYYFNKLVLINDFDIDYKLDSSANKEKAATADRNSGNQNL